MFSVAYNILNDIHKSEDIIHDCIVSFEKKSELLLSMEAKELSSYVHRSVKNKSLSDLKRSNRVITVDFNEKESMFEEISYDISLNIIEEEFIENIKCHLLKISNLQAEIFMYKYYYDYSNKQIAKLLSLTNNNVRVLIYRSKKNIKDYIEKRRDYE